MAAYDPLKLDDFEMPKDKEGFDFYIRRKVLKIFGGSFHVYDARDNLVFFSSQKAFKLKEDIRVFSDESNPFRSRLAAITRLVGPSVASRTPPTGAHFFPHPPLS